MKRILTIGHSYVVASNRRLAHEMALAGRSSWSVTAAAPSAYPGDLRRIELEPLAGEASELVALDTLGARIPHLMLYRGLRRLLSREWDVVHCWAEPYVASAAQVASLAPRSARIVFASFQNISKWYPPPLSLFERQVLRRADGWIAFGRTTHDAQRGRHARYAALPSRVITPGVDVGLFAPSADLRASARAALGWQQDQDVPVVGFVGRLVPEKGTATLLSALERVPRPWRALFVGDGPARAAIEAWAERRRDAVRVVAGARHDDVPQWMNAMDVLCAPSRTTPRWREQFGRMLIEAMACGVPVMASTSGEIPHVVADAGITLPERDVEQWSASLDRLLADAALRQEYAARGRRRAVERFAWPVVAAQHLQFFEELA